MEEIIIPPLSISQSDEQKIILMAGPCSAENEKQVMRTANELYDIGIRHFRAGLWKPRTKPGSFEGVGSKGLPWLQRVQREFGMTVATEIASATHARQSLDAGIDMLWLGARTTSSPFAVGDIAQALSHAPDTVILVKNPINPDIELWVGAIQRLHNAGIKQIGAIHRGFSSSVPATYRNPPHWQIPIELRRRFPDITILGDPSHIAGRRSLVEEVCRQAMEMHHSGLIIETHCDPNTALSDSAQQITPIRLAEILQTLRIPSDIDQPLPALDAWRTEIDELDTNIIGLLSKRMKLAAEIGQYKNTNNLAVLQAPRYRQMQEERLAEARLLGLSEDFILKLFSHIHEESICIQHHVLQSPEDHH